LRWERLPQFDSAGVLGMKTKLLGVVASLTLFGVVSPAYSSQVGFLYSGGNYTTIAPPGSSWTVAIGITDSAQIVGEYIKGSHPASGFLYSGGSYTNIDPSSIGSLNISGHGFLTGNPPITLTPPSGSSYFDPNSINASGQIVGRWAFGGSTSGFLYSGGTYTTIAVPGSLATDPTAINDVGQIAGYYDDGSSVASFLYSAGSYATIAVPGALWSYAYSINNAGQIVGQYEFFTCPVPMHRVCIYDFLYSGGIYTTINPPDSIFDNVFGINSSGQIVGTADNGLGQTPLPPALPLFASGLGLMGLFGWRRKRKNAGIAAS